MRTSKELILSSKPFTKEFRWRSWTETFLTLFLMISTLVISYSQLPIYVRIVSALITSLLYVRMFIIFHDYQHHALLQKSKLATFIMKAFGIYMLTPQNVWKRTHDHHHNHNSKLTANGIGSYPTVSKTTFLKMTKNEQTIYLINRHPVTILLGYFTLFIYWLNVKSFIQSPAKHFDSFFALFFHVIAGVLTYIYCGSLTFWLAWFFPFLLSFAIGSYLFYSQHNFPGAQFRENHDWKYDEAALTSTSMMTMNPILEWFTGNIGYHHVHHLNSRIPFYRLKEAMSSIPELQNVKTTSWNPIEMWRCFELKVWDQDNNEMIPLRKL